MQGETNYLELSKLSPISRVQLRAGFLIINRLFFLYSPNKEFAMPKANQVRDCPYCREEIKSEATLCKHCGSTVAPEAPGHGGTCPYCKEAIHEEAVRCKHCRSDLAQPGSLQSPCGCTGAGVAGAGKMAMLRRARPGVGSGWGGFDPDCELECFLEYLSCPHDPWLCELAWDLCSAIRCDIGKRPLPFPTVRR